MRASPCGAAPVWRGELLSDRTEPCTLAPRVEALERRVEALEREARERGACPARELLERVGV